MTRRTEGMFRKVRGLDPDGLRALPNRVKDHLIPPVGAMLNIRGGEDLMTLRVCARNVGKVRFTCELHAIVPLKDGLQSRKDDVE